MPVDQGGGIGGGIGGGSIDICSVSPSDQIGTINNILNRIQQLEAALSALLGTNVEAAQLSDISNNLGWVYNVTYLGEEGWTQTPSGTLIPPTGWTGLSGIIDGQNGLYLGGGGLADIKSVSESYLSDISSGANIYIHPNNTSSTFVNKGNTGLSEGLVNSGARTGWIAPLDTDFFVCARAFISTGTTPPSSGYVNLVIYLARVTSSSAGYNGAASGDYPKGGAIDDLTNIEASTFCHTSASLEYGFVFRLFNNTDGDIHVEDLQVTFIKL